MFSLLPVLGLILCVNAAFIHPPPYIESKNKYQDNPRYAWGSTVQSEWAIDAPKNLTLWLFMHYPESKFYNIHEVVWIEGSEKGTQPTTVVNWIALLQGAESLVESGEDGIFYLRLAETNTYELQFDSSYFNITAPKGAASTVTTTDAISSPTPTPTPTPTSASTTPTATPTSPPAASKNDEGSASGLPKGTVGGIAAGATIGGILVLGGLAFALWSRRKKPNKVREPGQGATELDSAPPSQVKGHRAKTESTELDSGPVYEMP